MWDSEHYQGLSDTSFGELETRLHKTRKLGKLGYGKNCDRDFKPDFRNRVGLWKSEGLCEELSRSHLENPTGTAPCS